MQADKLQHLAAGAAASVLTTTVAALVVAQLNESAALVVTVALWLGLMAPLVLGWAKEQLYDRRRPEHHTFDGWDAFATAGGAAAAPLGLGLAVLISQFLH